MFNLIWPDEKEMVAEFMQPSPDRIIPGHLAIILRVEHTFLDGRCNIFKFVTNWLTLNNIKYVVTSMTSVGIVIQFYKKEEFTLVKLAFAGNGLQTMVDNEN